MQTPSITVLLASALIAAGCASTPRGPSYAFTAGDTRAWATADSTLDFNGEANFGGGQLTSGFTPDPWAFPLTAGGGRNPINIADLRMHDSEGGTPCGRSFVTRRPDFHFQFNAGTVFSLLRFYVLTDAAVDATLVIREPNGHWRCNDDHGRAGWGAPHMPTLDFHQPPAGRYDIWVGSFDASANNPAQLYVTELDDRHP
ncbi:MAG: hypothetical protein KA978_09030 [Deltaproteobacteria bacterium]|jgi:hypothetical protein|nr:hypothetical protein [Deltaproteobacteria bacterium]MBP6830916.1 hypothetical protein [Deltaproteobacteria bacterium]